MTENLAVAPPPGWSGRDDQPDIPGRRTIRLCIDDPIFGVVVLGEASWDEGTGGAEGGEDWAPTAAAGNPGEPGGHDVGAGDDRWSDEPDPTNSLHRLLSENHRAGNQAWAGADLGLQESSRYALDMIGDGWLKDCQWLLTVDYAQVARDVRHVLGGSDGKRVTSVLAAGQTVQPTLALFQAPAPANAPMVIDPPALVRPPLPAPGLLLRLLGAGGAFFGVLLYTDSDDHETVGTAVENHPELSSDLTRSKQELRGRVTLHTTGPDGKAGVEVGTFIMDGHHNLRAGQDTPILGTVEVDGIHLTNAGEKLFAPYYRPHATAEEPPARAPDPLIGIVYDPLDRGEVDIVNAGRARGASRIEIENELEIYRNERGKRAAAGGNKGPVSTGQVASSFLPTPRDGVMGGKPTGIPRKVDRRAKRDTQEDLEAEDDTLEAIAAAGYRVERNPEVLPSDGLKSIKRPDARIGGNIFDVYAARTQKLERIRDALSDKVKAGQAFRLILNLSRVEGVTPADIAALLKRKPINGLRELLTVERNGAITRIFSQPERIIGPHASQTR